MHPHKHIHTLRGKEADRQSERERHTETDTDTKIRSVVVFILKSYYPFFLTYPIILLYFTTFYAVTIWRLNNNSHLTK
jgi:hypothetical protein